jgi:hypothetical protein
MAITFIDNFWNFDGRHLNRPDLACLRQDAETYSTMMFQVSEAISYNNTGIWITDIERANRKFYSFFTKANELNPELVITPEYSCPWKTLGQILSEQMFPGSNSVWVLGCQSITPKEILEFMQARPDIIWISEMTLINSKLKTNPDKFFDPVCIFLNTTDYQGNVQKVGIIQFKTEMFGGDGFEWERDNSIRGTVCYVVSNNFASTNLTVILCSDALTNPLDFNIIQNGFFFNSPLLLIHLQLNKRPLQSAYKQYRNLLFSRGDRNSPKEIVCLNWGWHIPDDHSTDGFWNHYGASGFYIKSDKLNLGDVRFNTNHHKGLYYTRWDDVRAHIYFLNYDEYVFLIKNTKPSQSMANPTQHKRSGPEVLQLFTWDNDWIICAQSSSYFTKECEIIEREIGELNCLHQSSNYINVERVVALSTGEISLHPDWFTPSQLKNMEVGNDEINYRITFTQDPSKQPRFRRSNLLLRYAILKHQILSNSDNLHDILRSVELKYDTSNVTASKDDYLINLYSTQNEAKGTGIYLGVSTSSNAQAVWDTVASLFKDYNIRGNILVWYHQGLSLRKIDFNGQRPTIKDSMHTPTTSFKKLNE